MVEFMCSDRAQGFTFEECWPWNVDDVLRALPAGTVDQRRERDQWRVAFESMHHVWRAAWYGEPSPLERLTGDLLLGPDAADTSHIELLA